MLSILTVSGFNAVAQASRKMGFSEMSFYESIMNKAVQRMKTGIHTKVRSSLV